MIINCIKKSLSVNIAKPQFLSSKKHSLFGSEQCDLIVIKNIRKEMDYLFWLGLILVGVLAVVYVIFCTCGLQKQS